MLFTILEKSIGNDALELCEIPFSRICYHAWKEKNNSINTRESQKSNKQQLMKISGEALETICAHIFCEIEEEKQLISNANYKSENNALNGNVNTLLAQIRRLNCVFLERHYIKENEKQKEEEKQQRELQWEKVIDQSTYELIAQKNDAEYNTELYELKWIAASDMEEHIFHFVSHLTEEACIPILIFTPFENLQATAGNNVESNNTVFASSLLSANDIIRRYIIDGNNKLINDHSDNDNKSKNDDDKNNNDLHYKSQHVLNLLEETALASTENKTDESSKECVNAELPIDSTNEQHTSNVAYYARKLSEHSVNETNASDTSNREYTLSKLALEHVSIRVTDGDVNCANELLQVFLHAERNSEGRATNNSNSISETNEYNSFNKIVCMLQSFACILCGRLPLRTCTLVCCGALLCEKCAADYNASVTVYNTLNENIANNVSTETSQLNRWPQQEQNKKRIFETRCSPMYHNRRQVECVMCHELLPRAEIRFHPYRDDQLRMIVRQLKVMHKQYFVAPCTIRVSAISTNQWQHNASNTNNSTNSLHM